MTTPEQIKLLARALARDDECAWADRLAHCAQCREDAEEYRKEATAILAQLGPLDPLGAEAMQLAAAKYVLANASRLGGTNLANGICELPLPTHADRLAAALAMPEIARLVDTLVAIEQWDAARGYPIPYRVRDPLRAALAALIPTADGETKGDA